MSTLESAIEIASRAHAGVRDKQGQPYILHPIRVMMGVESEEAKIVAVLHDVVEDTAVTLETLAGEGFSEQVLEALRRVTHGESQSYAQYVIGCHSNPIARQVKLSDLRDNANLDRLLLRPEKYDGDSSRMQRYVLSYRFLSGDLSETQYRELMTRFE